ncbi:MAG: NAD(P)-dependent oxidoreductase [Alphaproteobacteria bacterium]|nr:NAD(P)-dependent oxidoreductase [Alphaproteobacteria bacterium]MDP6811562.1 NAD(P)-dependent oxidoreductase [Alphaproteobacteria bacterium]
MTRKPDIKAGRLPAGVYVGNFADIQPPLDRAAALVEASRCYFCHDAPCIQACPTGIDIPGFIRGIATGNLRGAAMKILAENIFGGACARVCPTEVLCEGVCVRQAQEGRPVPIGRLQRHATDFLQAAGSQPFTRAADSGRRVAVVGAGPAGLACAHRLAVLGHRVTVYEARRRPGGLNEYGIAAYKVPDDFAQREIDFITAVGGIDLRCGKALGGDFDLAELRGKFDAVFLAMGQAGVRALEVEGGELDGVEDAIEFIARLRQADDPATLPVGRRVVVVGGGNTAIDIAVQCKRLGAEEVTIAYRRGPEQMGATRHEQEFAQINGVRIRHWLRPLRFAGDNGAVASAQFEYTHMGDDGRLVGSGETTEIPCDMAFRAVGQAVQSAPLREGGGEAPTMSAGRIQVDGDGLTSLPDVWAGGDCVAGEDLTVQAVQDGKLAATAIDRHLRG